MNKRIEKQRRTSKLMNAPKTSIRKDLAYDPTLQSGGFSVAKNAYP
jgi:hypothetical protein